jgi:hypothetical protein
MASLLRPERWRMTKLLGSGVYWGRVAWSQIQCLLTTTFNLKHNCDIALTIICYEKIKSHCSRVYSAFHDYVAICEGGEP